MLNEAYPYYLANKPIFANRDLAVVDKFTGQVATRVARADAGVLDSAIAQAADAALSLRQLPAFRRQAILEHCVGRFRERAEELAAALCIEAGKPIKDSRVEVARLIDTFRIAAEESVRIYGQVMPLDIGPRSAGYAGMWKRVPVGPVALITPFNFPLNLAAHKIAPALAVGCPFVLKPASATPIGALVIGEILAETDLPAGAFSILPCRAADAAPLVEDDRLKLLSFTGSADVGWELKRRAGKKRVLLELGGNAAVIVDRDTDLDDATARIVFGAFYQSGQSCISVQRILIHLDIYPALRDKLVGAVGKLKMGDPKLEDTFIGPMITEGDAERVESWVASAVGRGARLLCGGHRDKQMMQPTLLENVPADEPANCQEVFGPLAVLAPFDDFDAALAEVNNTRFGLQAGVFTRDIYKIQRAWDVLEVGGVIIGDVPSWRVDHMPYGGVKDSGIGREGIRFSMEEMTDIRLLAIRTPPGK